MPQTEHALQREPVRLVWEDVVGYLDSLSRKGCSPGTLKSYRWNIKAFLGWLDGAGLEAGTVGRWRDSLLEAGYQPTTVNHRLSSVNGLLAHLRLWEFQAQPEVIETPEIQPELTRSEYLRLLRAARDEGREQEYLLVKVFACTGVRVQELPLVTLEAVLAGCLALEHRVVSIPGCLKGELLHYAQRKGVKAGPVFITRTGRALTRTNVTALIQRLGPLAQVPREKCNPRCLRKLYLETVQGIERNVAALVEQAHLRLVEQEQRFAGWVSGGYFVGRTGPVPSVIDAISNQEGGTS